jgi:uncharacterized protein YjdB
MKKRKILVLFPFLGLLLSGCTIQEGFETVKSFFEDKVYNPVKDWITGGGKKEEPSGGETKTLKEIVEVKAPASIKKGETLAPSAVDLVVKYSDNSTETVKAESVELDTSKAGDAVKGKAKYKGLEKEFTIKVTDEGGGGVTPEHAGTEADPYSGADAVLVAGTLASGEVTEDFYYIKGKVESFEETFNAQYGNYSFKIEGGFIGWRLKNGPEYAKFNEGDLEVGDTVTMYTKIQAYGEECKPESSEGYIVKIVKEAPDAELVSVAITGTPKSAYLAGDDYSREGLKAIATYDNGEDIDVSNGATWTISKAKAEVGDTSITIKAEYEGKSAELVVQVTVQDTDAPVHTGTEADPYTGLDACIVASKLEESKDAQAKKPTTDSYYIKDVVTKVTEFSESYGNFTFEINGGFVGYRLLNGPDKAKFTSANDLQVGDTVTIYAQILHWFETYETEGGYIVSIVKAESNVVAKVIEGSAKGIPESVVEGGTLNKENITVGVEFKNGTTGEVHPDSIELDTSKPGDSVAGKLIIGEFEYPFTIKVTAKVVPTGDSIVFNLGVDGAAEHKDGTKPEDNSYSETKDDVTLSIKNGVNMYTGALDAKGNGCIKVGTSSAAGSFDIDLAAVEGLQQVIIRVAQYKSKTDGTIQIDGGEAFKMTKLSDNGEYDEVAVEITNQTKLSVAFAKRAMVNEIEFIVEGEPPVEVSSITLNTTELTLNRGANQQLTASILPEAAKDTPVTWSSSKPEVATVSESGLVTAVAKGSAVITATAGGKSATCAVTVSVDLDSITLNPSEMNLVVGNTGTIGVTFDPVDADNQNVHFASSNTAIAEVSESGVVTAKAAGSADITVTPDTSTAAPKVCKVTVTEQAIPVTSVAVVGDSSVGLVLPGEMDLVAHGMPENATESRSVSWDFAPGFENSDVVEISSSGHVISLKAGQVTVRATSVVHSDKYADVQITVTKVDVTSVELNKTELELTEGGSETLVATVSPDNASLPEVAWSSSNEDVATVTQEGLVSGKSVGEATITAEADGKSATCVVTVTEAPVVNTIQLAYEGAVASSTETFTFEGTVVSITGTGDNTSYILQDGAYAIQVRQKETADLALGKCVQVVSTVTLYQGCPQTNVITSATVVGDGTAQSSASVASKADLDALNHNVLAHIDDAVFVSNNGSWGSSSTKQFVFTVGEDNITVSFDRVGYDASKAAIANAAVPGDHFSLSGLVTAAYSGTNQLTFTGTAGIVKTADAPVPDPSSVAITSGGSLVVGNKLTLSATVAPSNASQEVEWSIVSGGEHATLDTTTNELTGVSDGEVVVRATAVGFESIYAEKTITVSSSVVPTQEATINFANQGYTNGQAIASAEFDGFTLTFDKGTNSNAPKYYDTGTAIRCYGGNTITLVAPDNVEITQVTLTFSSGEGTNVISTNVGSYENGVWVGEADNICFTIGGTSGHRRIATMTVVYSNK